MENTKKKPKHLWLLIGVPGCGKDTYLTETGIDPKLIVSRDKIRFAILNPEDNYFDQEKLVFKTFVYEIQETLNHYNICYANATNLNERSRLKLLTALAHDDIYINAIYFTTPVATCIERNKKREGRKRVPEQAIYSMAKAIQHPKEDRIIKYTTIVEVNNDLPN